MISTIDQIAGNLSQILHKGGTYIVIPILTIMLGVDVTLRYVFNSPLIWGNEVSALLLLLVFFSALPLCTRKGGHIRMDMLYRLMRPSLKKITDMLSGSCGLMVCGFLAYQSYHSTIEGYMWNEGAEMIDLPYWPFSLFMLLSSLILCLQFATQILFAARKAQSQSLETEE